MEIILYDEGAAEALNISEIAQYLAKYMGEVEIEVRGNPFASNLSPDELSDYASEIASIKIQQINQRIEPGQKPLYGEIEYEKRRLLGKTKAFGLIYDGFHLSKIYSEVIPREKRRLSSVHIIFTNRLFATWDNNDKRYHLRTSVYSIPSTISTTGIIEAPAKPREYYLLKQQYQSLRRDLTELKDRFKERFIDYEDERLTEVAKGLAMQAVAYSLTSGDPFCDDKGCRLYNAHWQEELIFAQLESEYELCQRHAQLLKKI